MNEAEKLAAVMESKAGCEYGIDKTDLFNAAALLRRQAEQIKVLQLQLLAASNYVDALGGDSKSYRSALAATKEET